MSDMTNSEIKKDELKPCPFCDSDAVLYGSNITTGFSVYCSKIECGVNIYDMYTKDGEQYATMRSKEDAIKAWNTRTMSTWLEGEVPTVESIKDLSNEFGFRGHQAEMFCEAIHALLTRKLTGKV